MELSKKEELVLQIRKFNRFYLPKFDLLNKTYLDSKYSTTEARILFEIVENKLHSACAISSELKIDKSYLSRILKKFEKNGLITKQISNKDARAFIILPTSKCEKIVQNLVKKANEKTKEALVFIDDKECEKLLESINFMIDVLSREGL